MSDVEPSSPGLFRRFLPVLGLGLVMVLMLLTMAGKWAWQIRQHEADIEFLSAVGTATITDPYSSWTWLLREKAISRRYKELSLQYSTFVLGKRPSGFVESFEYMESGESIHSANPGQIWEALGRQPVIKKIDVKLPVEASVLRKIAAHPKLEEVTFREECHITDEILVALPRSCPWKKVRVDSPHLTSRGIREILRKCRNLEEFTVPAHELTAELVAELAAHETLQSLEIKSFANYPFPANLSDLLGSHFRSCRLIIRGNRNTMTNLNLDNIVADELSLFGIHELEISNVEASELVVSSVHNARCHHLLCPLIRVNGTTIEVSDSPALERMSMLDYDDNPSFTTIARCDSLKAMSLWNGAKSIIQMDALPALTEVTLRELSVELAQELTKCQTIQQVEFYATLSFQPGGLAALSALPELSTIEFKGGNTEECVKYLVDEIADLKSLRHVRFCRFVCDDRNFNEATFQEELTPLRERYPHIQFEVK